MIIVDTREFRSKVVKELFERDVEFQPLQLQVGDYLIGEEICVERKSPKDFVDSLIDKRLFTQLAKMKKEYKRPIVIVEGKEDIFGVRKVHPNAIVGMISTIVVDYNIPIIFSRDEKQTADYIVSLKNRTEKEPRPIVKVEKGTTTKEVQERIVQSIPGIGVMAAKKLLKRFKRLKTIFNLSVEEIKGVEGIGEKVAKELYKISNEEYKD